MNGFNSHHEPLTSTIWCTWSWARGLDPDTHELAWYMGDYGSCIASIAEDINFSRWLYSMFYIFKNFGNSNIIGASRGIAISEFISSFLPGTFWRRDEILNRNFSIWAQVTYQQGDSKMGNAHWEDTSPPLHRALVLSLIEITDTIYICATGLSEEMTCLKSSVIFHLSNFYSSYARKYAMPFQQNHSFYL